MAGRLSPRAVAALVVAFALATPVAVAAVGAHGNHLAADSQVTSDGRVVVETVSALNPGFVVLRADEGGRPGDPLGSTYVERTPDLTYRTSVPVGVDASAWAEWTGNRTVWVVLHDDSDGDGEFDLGTDLSAARRSPAASTQITVGRSDDGGARVLGARFDAQPVRNGTITVRRVDLPAAGHVSVRPAGSNATVGSRPVEAGTHRNVTVPLNESFVATQSGDFRVRAVAHRDDGDGAFGPEDPLITVGDRAVGTYFAVAPPGESDDGPLINTPTVTTAPVDGGTATPPAAATDTDSPTPGRQTGAVDTGPTDTGTTAGAGPGFGVGLAALAVALCIVAVATRRR